MGTHTNGLRRSPKSEGQEPILVIVDRYNKYAYFMSLSHPYIASQVARVFMDIIYKLHGLPKIIVSDRDNIFLSNFWKEIFKNLKVQLLYTSAYNPQTDGQTERLNRCLENYLRCLTGHIPKDWNKWLSLAEYWYNSNYHSSLKKTSFKVVYGYDPPQLSFELIAQSKVDDINQLFKER